MSDKKNIWSFGAKSQERKTLDSILEPMKGIIADLEDFRVDGIDDKRIRE